MKILLRLIAGLAALALVALLTAVLIAPASAVSVLNALEEVSVVLRLALVVVIYALLLGLLILRLRAPRGHRGDDMLTVNVGGAVTAITVESARERVLKAVREVADVGAVNAGLVSARGRADIELDVTMKSDEVNIPAKQREISRAIEQVIKKQLGLRMAGPARINIRLSEPKPLVPAASSLPSVVVAPPTPVVSPPAPAVPPVVVVTPPPASESPQTTESLPIPAVTRVAEPPVEADEARVLLDEPDFGDADLRDALKTDHDAEDIAEDDDRRTARE
jgi:hypothetical protein